MLNDTFCNTLNIRLLAEMVFTVIFNIKMLTPLA